MTTPTLNQLSAAILEAREPVFSIGSIVLPRPDADAPECVITGVRYNRDSKDWDYLVETASVANWVPQMNVIPANGKGGYLYGKNAEYAVSAYQDCNQLYWYKISHSKGDILDDDYYPSRVEAFIAGRAHALRLAEGGE